MGEALTTALELQELLLQAAVIRVQLLVQRGGKDCCSLPNQVNQDFLHLEEIPRMVMEDREMVFEVELLVHQVLATRSLRRLPISLVVAKNRVVFWVKREENPLLVPGNLSELILVIAEMEPRMDFHSVKLAIYLQA